MLHKKHLLALILFGASQTLWAMERVATHAVTESDKNLLGEYSQVLKGLSVVTETSISFTIGAIKSNALPRLITVLGTYDAQPSSDITTFAEQLRDLQTEDLLELTMLCELLDLQPRVFLSGCIKALVDRITYTGPSKMLTEILAASKIEGLNENLLSRIAKQYYLKTNTETLDSEGNEYSYSCYSVAELFAYGKVPEIQNGSLDLSDKGIDSVEGFELISGNETVQKLDLSRNQLQALPDHFLVNSAKLKHLYLYDNQLQVLPNNFLDNCTGLELLRLYNNQLQALPDNFLDNCTELKVLRLYNNQLQALPDHFLDNCTELEVLRLNYNQLQKLPDNFLDNCQQLGLLYLEGNQLQALPDHFLVNSAKLKNLYLYDNQLQVLPANFLATCPKLELLWLQENQLPIEEVQNIRATLEQLGKNEDDDKIKLEPQNKPGKE